jgi:hypothetical protein
MPTPGGRSQGGHPGNRSADPRPSPYLVALTSARRIRRRDVALVEQYLAQIRTVASAQAKMGARRGGEAKQPP